jgi:hypothetical protein
MDANMQPEKYRQILRTFLLICMIPLALAGCRTGGPGEAVLAYHQALVDKDAERLATLSCADWEADARTELESFGAVSTTLEEAACQESSTEGDTATVTCTGKIVADYNGELLEIDLAERDYAAVQEGGEWRMCGYQ